MNNQKVIINVGVSGSGKSDWTKEYIKNNKNVLRINRDDIRKTFMGSLKGYYQRSDLNRIEEFVSQTEDLLFIDMLTEGYSVIIDNTNLKPNYINKWVEYVKTWNNNKEKQVELKFNLFREINSEILKRRVYQREEEIVLLEELNYIDKQIQSAKNIFKFVDENYKNLIYEN